MCFPTRDSLVVLHLSVGRTHFFKGKGERKAKSGPIESSGRLSKAYMKNMTSSFETYLLYSLIK